MTSLVTLPRQVPVQNGRPPQETIPATLFERERINFTPKAKATEH